MFEKVIIVILSGIIGSFLNMLIYRLPRKIDVIFIRSHCVRCKSVLGIDQLIPVLSWVLYLGKCKNCKEKIASHYVIVEMLTIFGFYFIYAKLGINTESILLMCVTAIFITISFIDLEHYIICDSTLIALIPCYVFLAIERNVEIIQMIMMPIIFFSFFMLLEKVSYKILSKAALGFGDIKLFSILAILISIEEIPLFLFLCGFFGIVTSLVFKKNKFPFAPSIVVATIFLEAMKLI